MKLSVVIPCYNEQDTIEAIIAEVRKSPFNKEMIIVDDGSLDNTRAILSEKYSDAEDINLVFQPFVQDSYKFKANLTIILICKCL